MTPGTIHLCLARVAPLAAAAHEHPGPWLSAAETARHTAFQRPLRRAQFLAGRWLARRLLVLRHGATPADWPMNAPREEAPVLLQGGPHISISHSGDFVACAVGDTSLGLDIESWAHPRDVLALAQLVCTRSERDWLAAAPAADRPRRFHEIWTAKEAWIKRQQSAVDPHRLHAIALTPALETGTADIRAWHTGDLSLSLAAAPGTQLVWIESPAMAEGPLWRVSDAQPAS